MTIGKKFKTLLIFVFSFVSFFLLPGQGFASSEDANAEQISSAGFTYNIEFPENQIDTSIGYFNLMMSPGQQQTISVILSNPGTEAMVVELDLNGAKTNSNGVIEYNNGDIENDASLPFPFEDIVTGPETVDLAAGETKQVELNIQMPETSFDGIIAGGLQLMRANQVEEANEGATGSRVVNQYAYAISILLQENDAQLTPELQYNRAYAGQVNYRNAFFINYSNIVATFLNDLTVEAQIMNQGSNEVLYEARTTSMRMAPNTFMDFPVSLNGDRMEPGTYTAHVLAFSGDQRWEWTEDFEVTEEEAREFNERDVGLEQETGIDWQLVAMLVGGFIAVVVLIFALVTAIRKNNKQKKKTEKQTNSGSVKRTKNSKKKP